MESSIKIELSAKRFFRNRTTLKRQANNGEEAIQGEEMVSL
jgi:hypothetical protein